MGKKFGNLARVTGVTFFRLSPHEQRAFAGAFEGGARLVKRFRSSFLSIAPIFLFYHLLREWATQENLKSHRKDPKEFENDT